MPPPKRKRGQICDSAVQRPQTKRNRPSCSPVESRKSTEPRRSTIDDYQCAKTISQGDEEVMVFEATHKATGEQVAIKVQHLIRNLPPEEVMYHAEVSGHHPSIVQLREVIVQYGAVYMVMDYIKDDLRSVLLRIERFDEERARAIMRQLLEALAQIHSKDILHRDISPENILVTLEGEIRVCDFGLACRSRGAYPAGKLPYCAPEMLLGGLEYTTAVDLWAAGCILYELLSGRILFNGGDEVDQLEKIFHTLGRPKHNEWPEFYACPIIKDGGVDLKEMREDMDGLRDMVFDSELSSDAFDLLSRLLATNPQCRLTADAALAHPWFTD